MIITILFNINLNILEIFIITNYKLVNDKYNTRINNNEI